MLRLACQVFGIYENVLFLLSSVSDHFRNFCLKLLYLVKAMHNSQMFQDYFVKKQGEILDDWFTFLRFKSISTDPEYRPEMLATANWLSNYLSGAGFERVEVWDTDYCPVVFAEHSAGGIGAPTLLIYNHYDVQPVDPIDQWLSDPFEPEIRNGQVYARGALDNKGQCFYVVSALKAYLAENGTFPCNIKLIIEGEEESGSKGLGQILEAKKQDLSADYLLVVDSNLESIEAPTVSLGMRGMCTFSVEATGSEIDLHSGHYGGVAYNPLHALVELLGSLRDQSTGRVSIEGFYDNVVLPSQDLRSAIFREGDDEQFFHKTGVRPSGGEKGLRPEERAWLRPTLEVNGISGGYSGPGFKTVIPAKAQANVSCRLVPNQDPERIAALVRQTLLKRCPPGIELKVEARGSGKAFRIDPRSRLVESLVASYGVVLGKKCGYSMGGGSIPVIPQLADASGAEPALMGYGLPGDQIHAPNEHFGLDRFAWGFLTICQLLDRLVPDGIKSR